MVNKLQIGLQAIRELGVEQTSLFALYQLGLKTGLYRRLTPVVNPTDRRVIESRFQPIFSMPAPDQSRNWATQYDSLLGEAEEITRGKVRLFGGALVPLNLTPAGADRHWSTATHDPHVDIKTIWEPARFGWVFTLGRAYLVSGDQRYPEAFWNYWEQFTESNPVNKGPNWESAQEVALRIIAYTFAAQVFSSSSASTPGRTRLLLQAIFDHAKRIMPTLIYARAQNNNHLISEACGLFIAGAAVTDHPDAKGWRETGWKWLEKALVTQIDDDGTYVQHSMNYHRMVLHLALLGWRVGNLSGKKYSPPVKEKLAAATRWLLAQMDPISGDAPNLGNNDGANILPLIQLGYRDHRAVAQAASSVFLGEPCLPPGPWDELSSWLGIDTLQYPTKNREINSAAVRRLGDAHEWATLRAVRYHSRPAHADQMHVELWHAGVNVLMDPGTGAYTSQQSLWNNGFVHSRFHNTVTIDNNDPMVRAGKFLWLNWDQADWIETECIAGQKLTAEHNGYKKKGVIHRRSLMRISPGKWEVKDTLDSLDSKEHETSIHWLMPDGQWSMKGHQFILLTGSLKLALEVGPATDGLVLRKDQVIRGGEILFGQGTNVENQGWYSPTYLSAIPVISYQVSFMFNQSVSVTTSIAVNKTVV